MILKAHTYGNRDAQKKIIKRQSVLKVLLRKTYCTVE